jgi:protoheme IX farnesyltransferase
MKSDYKDAGVPMLHVTHGRRVTRNHIGMAFTGVGGPIYLTTALILNGLFVAWAISIWRRDETISEADGYKREKAFFALSLIYLFLHFGAILAEATLAPYGIGGW